MPTVLYTLPISIIGTTTPTPYGSGGYGSYNYQTKNTTNSNSGSSSTQSSGGSSSAGGQTLTVTTVDTNTPYSSSIVQKIGTHPTFTGTAPPNSQITVTIHSNPYVCTTTADSQGNWSCTFTEDISPGLHTVDIVAVTPQGNTITLPPFQVQIVASVPNTTQTSKPTSPTSKGMSGMEIFGIVLAALVVLIVLIWLIVALVRRRKNKQGPPSASGPTTFSPTSGSSGSTSL